MHFGHVCTTIFTRPWLNCTWSASCSILWILVAKLHHAAFSFLLKTGGEMCWKNLVGWDENSQSALGISEINLIYCLLLTDIHTEKLKTPSPRPLSAAGPGLSHGTLVFLNWSHMGFLWTAALPALSPTTGPAGCSTPGAPPALTLVPAGLFSYISHSPLPAAVADFPFPPSALSEHTSSLTAQLWQQ